MRIVAGRFRGRRLRSSPSVRPTEERVREAIFSRVGVEVEGAHVLDLYAGTGALALEALSRGARRAVLVERDRRAFEAIGANIAALELGDEAVCMKGDVARTVGTLSRGGDVFDVVLADPPYAESGGLVEDSPLAQALQKLGEGGALAAGALVVIEHRRQSGGAASWPGFELEAVRQYGGTSVTYLRWTDTTRTDTQRE